MTSAVVDQATGNLEVAGRPVFPIVLSDPPPQNSTAPNSGLNAWAEIAAAGVTFVRNYTVWTADGLAEQLIAVGEELDAAPGHGLQLWLGLAGVANDLSHEAMLDRIVKTFEGHPGLGLWKGVDEPAHGHVPAAGCIAVYEHLRSIDPHHPVVIIEAPRGPGPKPGSPDTRLTAAAISPYAPACDIHGIDIYPLPPGAHAGGPPVNTDISVVGDMTTILAQATKRKALWTTLQIAWSGVFPPHRVVFPTLQQARFMAYDAIVAGARGLAFFGGQFKQVMSAADRERGWNWSYWSHVQRPLLVELTDAAHRAALTAPKSTRTIKASASDIALSVREAAGFLYLIAVRKSPSLTGGVRFSGLPAGVAGGTVLEHPGNPARHVEVAGGRFEDPSPFAPHNARVYRFQLPAS
ncbi:MAG TPA: hypothetical protein VH063_05910 [Gaiellaceae bacterium]|jgi:hypothetical protein|nr:hypothetical protein [Gaiellaceae bacterium]